MSDQVSFPWPANQDTTLNIQLDSPTNISGWSIQFDLMYRLNSPNPLYSAFTASGFADASGINITDGANGIFQVPLFQSIISGVMQETNVIAYRARRTDSGSASDIDGGLILLSPF